MPRKKATDSQTAVAPLNEQPAQTSRELTDNMKKAAELWALGKADGTAVTKKRDLAQLVGVTDQAIMQYFRQQRFLDEIDRLLKEQTRLNKQAMIRYVPEAIDSLVRDMREAPSARDRITAARAILDMAGMNDKTVNVNVNGEIGVVRGGFGKDALAAAADIIETEYTILGEDDPDEVPLNAEL